MEIIEDNNARHMLNTTVVIKVRLSYCNPAITHISLIQI